ncbi:hypothetical protein MES4922_420035 [Mesorhizobium ventifaucium]|uniref:Uncharacterized protein n=1 Tax=Mesorhizobium ventifaucium TaxID=666020 RepID=A0ABM9EA00_9HYPH|nr:hypothetical protein MES4922_420035 [Mesorhizobium ventifaucium]
MGAGPEAALPGHIENALREIKMIGARASGNGLHGVSRERARPLRFEPIALAGAIGWISRRFSKLWIDVLFSAIVLCVQSAIKRPGNRIEARRKRWSDD